MRTSAGSGDDSPQLQKHKEQVSGISKQIAQFNASHTPFRIFHGTTNSTRPSVRTKTGTVDISSLNRVLFVDTSTRRCLVEPNVPMDALVAATLPHGLVPPVVPEFPGITVGGAVAGTAGESSSFRHGFFDKSITWAEVVLADGEVVVASKEQNEDLFSGLAGTFGTLGVATLFEMTLIPAKEYVELSYIPVASIEDAQEVIREVSEGDEMDFLDGIMFAPDKGVVMAGKFADKVTTNTTTTTDATLPIVTFSGAWDQWFYLHAEQMLRDDSSRSKGEAGATTAAETAVHRDLIPLTDYLFRYDRGAFWTGRFAFTYFLTPFTRVSRWLLDRYMHTRVMYHALHRSGLMQRFIVQDMALPNKNIPRFSRWLDAELPHIYPRWLCPLRTHETVSMHPHLAPAADSHDDVLLNIGVWGPTPPGARQVAVNRRIEAVLGSLHGMKWLYAQTFYTEDEFWRIYDRPWYDALRKKYRAENLPSVYEKVRTKFDDTGSRTDKPDKTDGTENDDGGGGGGGNHPADDTDIRIGVEKGFWSVWPFAGIYGVLSAIKGGDYLRKNA
ncbi:hypothetical protein PV08_10317 [Exophiala spinifera]|uniref:Delta(24)-sterol reductase n=1 Tax=Exophiala spinifera TaxID=91928 RepID=A0A0D2AWF5_9EURO|nr:uncharacterized protein PV08_10317 [Exophiala spinifera]KIW11018.1 hypothetical protein PV08_10317 [Exophiala spinifera]